MNGEVCEYLAFVVNNEYEARVSVWRKKQIKYFIVDLSGSSG